MEQSSPASAPLAPAEAAALLRSTLTVIAAEAAALSPAQLRQQPSAGAWCFNEVLGHLIEAERRGFAGRIRSFLEYDQPQCEPWDPPVVAHSRDDCARDGRELVREFEQLRSESLALVERLAPEQLDRAGQHPTVGTLSVRDLLHEWVFHDRSHLQQIFDIVKALMWPHMGNSRRFSSPQD